MAQFPIFNSYRMRIENWELSHWSDFPLSPCLCGSIALFGKRARGSVAWLIWRHAPIRAPAESYSLEYGRSPLPSAVPIFLRIDWIEPKPAQGESGRTGRWILAAFARRFAQDQRVPTPVFSQSGWV